MNDMMTPEEPHISDGWTFATLYKLCMQMFASVEIKAREIELRQQQRYEAQESIRNADRLYFDMKVQDLHELKAHDFVGAEKLIISTRADIETKINNIRDINIRDLQSIEQRFGQSKEAVAD